MLPLLNEAYENVKKQHPNKPFGADEIWPQIQIIFSAHYGQFASQLSILQYFHLYTLFDDLTESSCDEIQNIKHGEFCQPVVQVINLTTPYLATKAIPEFVESSNQCIDGFVKWGTTHNNDEVTRAAHVLATKLAVCRDEFIQRTIQNKETNQGYKITDDVPNYRRKIREIIESSTEIKLLSSQQDWPGIIGNVLIGLTGIGLVALAVKAAHSQATTGQASLFFDTNAAQKAEQLSEDLLLMKK
ncbi:hypothetical protein [Piscirickettsia salmonis]|uniref:hypothetical protein n=1 Tax=Piscirickettsia salmonis TaxID=1238 RepID=UPI0007D7AFEB|nr:hypothetical protein A0O36_02809 [Piscirickettsiaceae bacterium NZ-RLO1]